MNITKTTPGDYQEIVSLMNNAYRGENAKKGWTTEADLLGGIRIDTDTLKEMLSSENAAMLKYTNEHNIIEGCVYVDKKIDKLYLGMLTVSPDQQAKGIGKKLMAAAEDYAKENNYTIIQMTVISVREELIKWYKRHGYNDTGATMPFPDDERFGVQKQPLKLIIMEKDIRL